MLVHLLLTKTTTAINILATSHYKKLSLNVKRLKMGYTDRAKTKTEHTVASTHYTLIKNT